MECSDQQLQYLHKKHFVSWTQIKAKIPVNFKEFSFKIMSVSTFITKFPYNAHSDWLKQRALSENKARVNEGKLAFEFVIRNFDKFDPN